MALFTGLQDAPPHHTQVVSQDCQEEEQEYRCEERFLMSQITGSQLAVTAVVAWLFCSSALTGWYRAALGVFVFLQVLSTLWVSYYWGSEGRRDRFLDQGALGADKDTVFGLALLYCIVWAAVFWRLETGTGLRRFLLGYLFFLALLLIWLFFY